MRGDIFLQISVRCVYVNYKILLHEFVAANMNICVSFYHIRHRQISGLKCISIWNGLFYLTNSKQDKGFHFNLFFKAFTRHLGP